MFSIIAAIGKNKELGYKGELVFHIKKDMQFFKNTTLGHKVIMGRTTWESLPGKLPGRENIVAAFHGQVLGADLTVTDLADFKLKNEATNEEIFVIGGASIYREFLDVAKNLYLTEIDAEAEADAFFPDFDKTKYTKTVLGRGEENGVKYQFVKYVLN